MQRILNGPKLFEHFAQMGLLSQTRLAAAHIAEAILDDRLGQVDRVGHAELVEHAGALSERGLFILDRVHEHATVDVAALAAAAHVHE